jgi:endonuclease YncB( thermonuclease family)
MAQLNYTQIKYIHHQFKTAIMFQLLKPILDESQQSKKGITFFVNGNTVIGYVVRVIDEVAVEVKNQRSSKVLIRMDKIDAVELS